MIGEPVPHRNAGELRQQLHVVVREPSELDAVVHPSEHASGVLHGLLVAQLRLTGTHVGHVRPLIVGGDFEGGPRARGRLLEDQRDVLALEPLLLGRGPLLVTELFTQVEEAEELLSREVDVPQETAPRQGGRRRQNSSLHTLSFDRAG